MFDTPVRGGIHPDVSFLAQNRPLYRDLTVRELVRVAAGMNERWSRGRVHEVLGLLPRLLLPDEPLSDLESLVMGRLRASRERRAAGGDR
ncbi:hypothetical protein [Actinosynnema pretiosum]|uniref:Uncharacterized protein n=1 Tax=Actinosynnema pretiosum TaxID=42197 RepID=A0A290Z702_9PSEU|nr:hypothetical protein [Actinosynnema pretiosum]ATE54778.1 hypothetical protein CNX65_17070 [Actinosynnema pretiosum]